MVGDGPLRTACESYAMANRINIRFAGFMNQSDIAQAYVAADALTLPSDGRETWGLVVNEAMVCGRPCLVSDHVGCAPDLIEEGRTGGVFTLDDADSFATALGRYSVPDTLALMGERARQKIKGYSVESAAVCLIGAVEQTIGRPPGPRRLEILRTGLDTPADFESSLSRNAAAG